MLVFEGVHKMKNKWAVFAALAALLILTINSASEGVDTGQIDKVRNKEVLNNKDLQIIDKFVAESVQELMKTRDFTSIAKVRAVISSRNSSNMDSASAQYAEQFSESARKYISEAFEAANELTPEEHKFRMTINLLILVDSLEDLRLADLAKGMINDENEAIRYWAVHSLTNPGFIEQLNATEETKSLASNIIEQLKDLVESSKPEILALMTEFTAEVDIPQTEDLLLQIANIRIKRYANWTVEYELLDSTILRLLDNKMFSGGMSNSAIARRFGQLYSYVIQRYVKGQDLLSGTEKQRLASVVVETEVLCINKHLGTAQSAIKKAVEDEDYITLLKEHNRLLGEETKAGLLPLKLNFDYGKKPDGSRRTAPLALPEPPKTRTPS